MPRLIELFRRAQEILRTEGLMSLIRRGLRFFKMWLFNRETYYLYEHQVARERDEADFLPRIKDVSLEIVFTNQQADDLTTKGFEFLSADGKDSNRLDKGAIVFCFFVGRDLAHKGWVAMSEEAQQSLDRLPRKVDYSKNEAYCGATFTNPKYRGNGLMTYGYFKRLQFLKDKGRTIAKNTVAKDNIASHKALANLKPRIYAQARYLKILGFKFWKEELLQAKPF